tara:strand:+ start:1412 stop:1978 length:567 start_codon:yes stop_codon:yes gene_type:complete
MQELIYLRPLSSNDINDKYLFWVNDSSITEYLEIGKQNHEYEDLERYVNDSKKNGRHNYAAITKNSQNHIGNGSIYSIELEKRKFQIGWFVGEKNYWGGHYSSMIIFYLFKIGFIEMGLDKCCGYVEKTHIKARMTNKFSGFKEKDEESRLVNKKNKNKIFIKLEINKKEWLARAKILHSQYPELYKF